MNNFVLIYNFKLEKSKDQNKTKVKRPHRSREKFI